MVGWGCTLAEPSPSLAFNPVNTREMQSATYNLVDPAEPVGIPWHVAVTIPVKFATSEVDVTMNVSFGPWPILCCIILMS